MAGSPTFFGEGHTPRITDPLWVISQKILGAVITGGGAGGGLVGVVSPQGVVTAAIGTVYYDSVADTFWINLDGAVLWKQLI